jgi:hypothetical protein
MSKITTSPKKLFSQVNLGRVRISNQGTRLKDTIYVYCITLEEILGFQLGFEIETFEAAAWRMRRLGGAVAWRRGRRCGGEGGGLEAGDVNVRERDEAKEICFCVFNFV